MCNPTIAVVEYRNLLDFPLRHACCPYTVFKTRVYHDTTLHDKIHMCEAHLSLRFADKLSLRCWLAFIHSGTKMRNIVGVCVCVCVYARLSFYTTTYA